MDRAHMHKFGNWEQEDDVQYTEYFEKARKGRDGKTVKPNDSSENADKFSDNSDNNAGLKGSLGESSMPSHQEDSRGLSSGRPNSKQSAGSEHRGKAAGGGGDSPAGEVKSLHDSGHGNHTPVRSRLRQANYHGIPDTEAPIPRFGGWDDNNPQDAENFTEIFERARDGRHNGSSNVSVTKSEPSNNKMPKQRDNPKGCCFSWLRKRRL